MLNLDIGDIVWAELDPVKGTEQANRRPSLILTSAAYHQRASRAVICPITRAESLWTFHLPLPIDLKTKGFVQIDQVRTVDRGERLFRIIERVPAEFMASVQARLAGLLNIDMLLTEPNSF